MDVTVDEIIAFYVGQLNGLKVIGKKIKKDPRTFKQNIIDRGFQIPYPGSSWTKFKNHAEKKFANPINKEIQEIIIGSLLGDAQIRVQSKKMPHNQNPSLLKYYQTLNKIDNLRKKAIEFDLHNTNDIKAWNDALLVIKNTNTASLRFHKSILELEWVKLLENEFKSCFKTTHYIKKKGNKNESDLIKWTCGFDTSASVQLFDIWKDWYKIKGNSFIKVFSKKPFELSPNILLHWYIGDGTMSGNDFSIATQCFTLDEHYLIKDILESIDLKVKIKNPNKKKPFISFSTERNNIQKFLEYISEAKLYKKALNIFPHKFNKNLKRKDWVTEILRKNPGYINPNSFLIY